MSIRTDLDQLLELQSVDSKRDAALKARSNIDNGSSAQTALQHSQNEANAAKATSSQTAAELKDAELELAGVESKIKVYEQKMRSGTLTNSREIANVEKEIHQLCRQRATLDDKILNLMDLAEQHRSSVSTSDERLKQTGQALEGQRSLSRQTLDRLNTEINRLESEKTALMECLAGNPLLAKYDALRARPAAAGLAIVKIDADRHCGGCHLPVSQQYTERVKEASNVITCENCGRILA